jgi:hypothetical protein
MIFLRGAHAPSRAGFGALAETISPRKIREREGAFASTRGACAPQIHAFTVAPAYSPFGLRQFYFLISNFCFAVAQNRTLVNNHAP